VYRRKERPSLVPFFASIPEVVVKGVFFFSSPPSQEGTRFRTVGFSIPLLVAAAPFFLYKLGRPVTFSSSSNLAFFLFSFPLVGSCVFSPFPCSFRPLSPVSSSAPPPHPFPSLYLFVRQIECVDPFRYWTSLFLANKVARSFFFIPPFCRPIKIQRPFLFPLFPFFARLRVRAGFSLLFPLCSVRGLFFSLFSWKEFSIFDLIFFLRTRRATGGVIY